jgi:hypothetical protein
MSTPHYKLDLLDLIPPSECITRKLDGGKVDTPPVGEIMHPENLIKLFFPFKGMHQGLHIP